MGCFSILLRAVGAILIAVGVFLFLFGGLIAPYLLLVGIRQRFLKL